MRRLVALGLAVVLAAMLVGCGGGGGETTTTTEPTGEEAAAPVANTGLVNIPDRSVQESQTFQPLPAGDFVPKDVSDRIASKQPMLLFFYDGSQKVTDDQRAQIDSVLADNRGLMDLVSYDVGKYASVDTSGVASTSPDILKDDKVSKGVLLARALKVSFTPYIVIVDEQGYITFRVRGPIDAGLLEPEVLRAAK